MPINDPQAIRFVNERARPLSESVRAIGVQLRDCLNQWPSIEPLVGDDSREPIEDRRDSEGVSRLNGAEIHRLMEHFESIAQATEAAAPIVGRACVRAIEVR